VRVARPLHHSLFGERFPSPVNGGGSYFRAALLRAAMLSASTAPEKAMAA